jgi:hypothetical protein
MAAKVDYPKTRKEAMQLGLPHYFTGKPCGRGHIAPRKTKGSCVECLQEDWKRDYDKRAEYFKEYNNSERGKEVKRRYYEENKEVVLARAARRPDEAKNRYKQKHKEQNQDYYKALTNQRRRRMRQATPPWTTLEHKRQIREKYLLALAMTKETGVPYVVDHIIPLHGEEVCGLHVPWNLQVMTREDNLRKSNKLIEE